jgi:hypothetical protein
MEALTAIIPLIPSLIIAGKSAWNELIKPLLIGKGYNIPDELEKEMLRLEKAKDIDGFIELIKNIEKEINTNNIKQSYNGDGGNQIGINTGTINNYNFVGTGKKIKQETRLSENACQLLKEMSFDPIGQLLAVALLGGYQVQTNGKSFGSGKNDGREMAEINAAIEELEDYDLIRPTNYERNIFKITNKGYKIADKITI